ncbi:MAG: right-handed parallel beta-helix repeat-containing protein, partial [Chitinophagaceae bacterium]
MKISLFLVALCLFLTTNATNYYFSANSGDDNRSGAQAQDPNTPWQTIKKLNAIIGSLQPGDNIYFKRGETFYGTITVNRSGTTSAPITFSAFGTGSKPVITGFASLTNWVSIGNGIWESYNASLPTTVNSILVNGVAQEMGRYPNSNTSNKGYLTYESHPSSTSITDNELTSANNWTGAEVVVRKYRWVMDRHLITSHSGNTLSYVQGSTVYSPVDRNGYFIQNHINTLDKFGEWYNSSSEKKIKLFTGATAPSSQDVKASSLDNLVFINSQNNIVFDNISFSGANTDALRINGAQNIQINNCDVLFSGRTALKASYTTSLKVENNTVLSSNNSGIDLENNNDYSVVRNNRVENTHMIAGLGQSGDGNGIGIISNGNGGVVEYNEVINTGYTGISFQGGNILIKNNLVDGYCLTKDDGGGVYTYTNPANPIYTGRRIIGNIIINGTGAGAGTNDPNYFPAMGIYLDDNTSGIEVSDNTVANVGYHGIFFHNTHDILVKNNTFYNNKIQLTIADYGHDLVRNNDFYNNIFFSKFPDQRVSSLISLRNEFNLIGALGNNYYCRPLDDQMTIVTDYIYNNYASNKVDLYSVEGWKLRYGLDAGSQKSPLEYPAYIINSLTGAEKVANGTFNSGIGYPNNYSPVGNISTSWNNGKLDGGSLQVSFPNQSVNGALALTAFPIGGVLNTKKYLVKFSLLGAVDNKSLGVYIRNNDAPYNTISPMKYVKIGTTRSENEVLLEVSSTVNNADIVFEVNDQCGTFWLDNIQLQEVNATFTNPDNYIRFEYNPSGAPKTVSLDRNYIDVKSNSYSNSVTIAPYSSLILLTTTTGASVVKTDQTINFSTLPAKTVGDAPFALDATASSGLPVTFRVISGPATLSGNMVSLTGSGSVVIEASQAGNASFNPAPSVNRDFTVTPATAIDNTPPTIITKNITIQPDA